MKNTTFVQAAFFAAAGSLLAAPQAPQSAPITQTSTSVAQPDFVRHDWIEQHLKGKQGRYSRAEETRLEDVKNSAAYRAEPPAVVPDFTWIDQHRKTKQGQ